MVIILGNNNDSLCLSAFVYRPARLTPNFELTFSLPLPTFLVDPSMDPYPHQFATALFSFLYHLASYDAGGEALVSCGMMEALLKVFCLFYFLMYLWGKSTKRRCRVASLEWFTVRANSIRKLTQKMLYLIFVVWPWGYLINNFQRVAIFKNWS